MVQDSISNDKKNTDLSVKKSAIVCRKLKTFLQFRKYITILTKTAISKEWVKPTNMKHCKLTKSQIMILKLFLTFDTGSLTI